MADENQHSAGNDPMVAEYVLGVLDAKEHAQMAERLARDPLLQAQARFWQTRLSSLNESFEEATPPAATFGAIEKRLFGTTAYTGPFAAFWSNLALWRGLAAGGIAIAVLALGVALWQPAINTQDIEASQYVANLAAKDSDVSFVALYNAQDGVVRISGLTGQAISGKDYELWFIQGQSAPMSLGVVPVNGRTKVQLTDQMRQSLSDQTVFAVTLEPRGGAPEGVPTGPVVAAGPVQQV